MMYRIINELSLTLSKLKHTVIPLPSNVAMGLTGSYFAPHQNEKVQVDDCGSCFSCGCFAVLFVSHKQPVLI